MRPLEGVRVLDCGIYHAGPGGPAILGESNVRRCLMFFGVLLIIMGILMFLDRIGVLHGDMWNYFWPTVIIAIGISMIFKDKRPKKH